MQHEKTYKGKMIQFFTILGPILMTQISLNAMTLFDTMMSGRAGTNDLAGVAIGASLWMPVSIGLNGILLAVTPLVAQLYGKGDLKQISRTVTQALYLSLVLAVVIVVAGGFALNPILTGMNLEPAVHHIAQQYLIALSFGIIPLFISSVLRYFFDAHGYTRISMTIMLVAVPINIVINYLLIFGNWGFPRLGGIGAGYATAITYWLILLFSIVMTFKVEAMSRYKLFVEWFAPSWKTWKEQLKIGVPMGLSVFFEASIFSVVTLLMGMMFNTVTIAAHQAAISFTTMIFMIPLSISMSLTIIIAYEVGSGRYKDARQYSRFGVLMAIGILAVCSVFLYIFREQIAYFYTDSREVVELTMQFLLFAIVYQLSDAAQASLQGVLRGYKDVTFPFIIALVSYWIIGMPTGYALAAYTAWGPYGFWLGITIGLTFAAVGFYIRLLRVQRKYRVKGQSV
ncbi:MATE family efflux transporter [Paenibacillus sp. RC67]|uniref:MATE family efflux transporter n=1 Tax=Paenibacillus sp. RC67 TaxID=3039392 RepID=UPI0024AD50A0|nr:MATE family efflux transporter [Paenibacillus sp. RC67]